MHAPAQKLLLLDTCGEPALVGLSVGDVMAATMTLPPRAASAELVAAVRQLLTSAGMHLNELDGVGVVSGPGSFTGVRAGLAAAKGLCEASGLRLAVVSRLATLVSASGNVTAVGALYAGANEVYLSDGASGNEWLVAIGDASDALTGRELVVAEERLLASMAAMHPRFLKLNLEHVLPLVRRAVAEGGSELAAVDGNYVRSENAIYRRTRA